MKNNLRITKNANGTGCLIIDQNSTLYSDVGYGRRMDGTTGFTYSGTFGMTAEELAVVEPLIREVIETGVAREVELGSDPVDPPISEWKSRRGLTLNEEMEREDTMY